MEFYKGFEKELEADSYITKSARKRTTIFFGILFIPQIIALVLCILSSDTLFCDCILLNGRGDWKSSLTAINFIMLPMLGMAMLVVWVSSSTKYPGIAFSKNGFFVNQFVTGLRCANIEFSNIEYIRELKTKEDVDEFIKMLSTNKDQTVDQHLEWASRNVTFNGHTLYVLKLKEIEPIMKYKRLMKGIMTSYLKKMNSHLVFNSTYYLGDLDDFMNALRKRNYVTFI